MMMSMLSSIFPACLDSNLKSSKSKRFLKFVGFACFYAYRTRLLTNLIYCTSTNGFRINVWSFRFPNRDCTNLEMNFSILSSSRVWIVVNGSDVVLALKLCFSNVLTTCTPWVLVYDRRSLSSTLGWSGPSNRAGAKPFLYLVLLAYFLK